MRVFPAGAEFGMREPPSNPQPHFFSSGVYLSVVPPFQGVLCSVLASKRDSGFPLPLTLLGPKESENAKERQRDRGKDAIG